MYDQEMSTRHSYPGFAYWGECVGWGEVIGQHRDSEPLERSNFDVIRKDLESRFPQDVTVESSSHWAVGWTETVLVRPESEAWTAALEWRERLAQYPVADDEDYSRVEWEDSVETIRECLVKTSDLNYGWNLSEDQKTAMANAIVSVWTEDGTRDVPGLTYTRFPNLDEPEDRDLVAAGIRQWRKWRAGRDY